VRGLQQQTSIYAAGVSGARPRVPTDATMLEERAREAMSPEAFAYVAGGAGTGATMRANRAAFDRWRIVPRMLRDVAERDTSVELFGRTLPAPFLIAPIGVLEMAHRDAERAVARAIRDLDVPMIYSNQASVAMEEVTEILGDAPRWFQLYWSTRRELVESFARRAEACGCEAIAVTLDTTMLGWRTRDLDLGWLPFLRGMGIAQYTSDPVFTQLLSEPADSSQPEPKRNLAALRVLVQLVRNYPDSFLPALRSGRARAAVQRFVQIYSRPSLTWADLPFLRERTSVPILLKGILHPDDARRAVDEGIDGIVVSNHGGRQVDGAIATLDALPPIVDAVDGRIPVLLDSGVRSGADIFKALALGARAVLLGRPYVYGLALAGEAGVREVVTNFIADFDLTMGLAGYRSVAEIGPEALVPAPDVAVPR
jgi:lactate 2-monooxygenase